MTIIPRFEFNKYDFGLGIAFSFGVEIEIIGGK